MNIDTVPIKSAIKPNIQTLKMIRFAFNLISVIFRYFIVNTTTSKSIRKFAGKTTSHVMGINHRSHIGTVSYTHLDVYKRQV